MADRSAAALAIDPAQQRTLTALLDELVPARPEVDLPGAGGLQLADAVANAAAGNPALASVLADTLAQLAESATPRGGASFAELVPEDRRAALDELAARAPGHLPALCFLTFAAYYQEPRVLAALGHPARPPYPLGYEVPPTDFSLLDAVRRRAPFYRRL
jgi:hypothetical protein